MSNEPSHHATTATPGQEPAQPQDYNDYKPIHDAILADLNLDLSLDDLTSFPRRLLRFQELHLGPDAVISYPDEPRPTRIPSSFLSSGHDLISSSFHHVVHAAAAFRKQKGWTKWTFESKELIDANVDLVRYVRKELHERGRLKVPVVYLNESTIGSSSRSRILNDVKSMEGVKIVALPTEATHVIHEAESVDVRKENDSAWHVTSRWLLDSKANNEWAKEDAYVVKFTSAGESASGAVEAGKQANEKNGVTSEGGIATVAEDSEMVDVSGEQERQNAESVKPASSVTLEQATGNDEEDDVDRSARTAKKRSLDDVAGEEDVDDTPEISESKRLKLREKEQTPAPDADTESMNVDPSDIPENVEVRDPEEVARLKKEKAARIATESKAYFSEQTKPVILPPHASWFRFDQINDIEKKALPDFFSGRNQNKSPATYTEYRDFIINTYRLTPHEHLTVTACRRNLAGDVGTIVRLHAFLEKWGLINNHEVDPSTRPSPLVPPYTAHFQITADLPKGLQSFEPRVMAATSVSTKTENGKKSSSNATCTPKYNLELRENIFRSDAKSVDGTADGDTRWSSQEKLLLLEGIEMYEEDWGRVAAHVGTRTSDECATQFLDLPIDDFVGDEIPRATARLFAPNLHRAETDDTSKTVSAILATIFKEWPSDVKGHRRKSSTAVTSDSATRSQDSESTAERRAARETSEQTRRLMQLSVDNQIRSMESKLRHFEEFELAIENERKELERQRKQLLLDRLQFAENFLSP